MISNNPSKNPNVSSLTTANVDAKNINSNRRGVATTADGRKVETSSSSIHPTSKSIIQNESRANNNPVKTNQIPSAASHMDQISESTHKINRLLEKMANGELSDQETLDFQTLLRRANDSVTKYTADLQKGIGKLS